MGTPSIKKNKQIAVVILNWNGKEMMRRFLPSVVRYSEELAEVIVADNASTDGSLEMLKAEFPTVATIVLDQNYGFAEGYNRALAQVDYPYLLLLNSDVEVRDGCAPCSPTWKYMPTWQLVNPNCAVSVKKTTLNMQAPLEVF